MAIETLQPRITLRFDRATQNLQIQMQGCSLGLTIMMLGQAMERGAAFMVPAERAESPVVVITYDKASDDVEVEAPGVSVGLKRMMIALALDEMKFKANMNRATAAAQEQHEAAAREALLRQHQLRRN
jgi:hypothetical protein